MIFSKKMAFLILLFSMIGIVVSGNLYSYEKSTDALNAPVHLNRSLLKFGSAGYGAALGSVTWIYSILEYSGVIFSGEKHDLIYAFQQAADLDTNWSYPRLIAGWALPQTIGYSAKDALPFLEDGARRFPNQWKFRITWAQYVLDARDLDSTKARDSAVAILLPLSSISSTKVPQYVRNLAFTLLHKNGKPEEAMSLLLQTYSQVPDPMVRYQFRGKIGDLLWRNNVSFGRDSSDFLGGVGALLESKDPAERQAAGQLLTDLVDSTRRDRALDAAHQLAAQYAAYSRK